MFGIDLKKVAVSEIDSAIAKIKKIDANHNGVSDLEELKTEVHTAIDGLEFVASLFKPGDAERLLELMFPGRVSAEQVKKLETSFAKLVALEPKVEALVTEIRGAIL